MQCVQLSWLTFFEAKKNNNPTLKPDRTRGSAVVLSIMAGVMWSLGVRPQSGPQIEWDDH